MRSLRYYGRTIVRTGNRVAAAAAFIIKIALGVALGLLLFSIAAPFLAG